MPETEKRGRVQTSTVTVAVLREPTEAEVRLDPRDLDVKVARGSGPGGQHRNKTESAVHITHLPTGLQVRCDGERSQHQNRDEAMRVMRARLLQQAQERASGARAQERRDQVGSGQRGDKVRTVAMQRDQVTDHRNGKRITTKAFLRGDLEGLY